MKSIYFKAACLAAVLSSPWIGYAQQQYYVVIGAFATDEKANEFKGYLPSQSKDTSFTFTEKESLLHLYVLKTSDKEGAISKTLQLRQEIQSMDSGTPTAPVPAEVEVQGNEFILAGSEKLETPGGGNPAGGSGSGMIANAGAVPVTPKGKFFKFTIETPEGNALPGQVHHVDFANRRELAAYNSDTFVDLLQPGENTKPMEVVFGRFGYKEIQKYIDYNDPSTLDNQAYLDSRGTWVIPYVLEPVEKGDVSVMYNVSFYKDAVVMKSQSQSDLDHLVTMMRNNPYLEITIHSHCNGKNKREIIGLGANKNYFDVSGSVTFQASAKELTGLRAEAVRSYLADHGIDEKRSKIFSWGGSDMLVKGSSAASNLNDRIEIEVTRD